MCPGGKLSPNDMVLLAMLEHHPSVYGRGSDLHETALLMSRRVDSLVVMKAYRTSASIVQVQLTDPDRTRDLTDAAETWLALVAPEVATAVRRGEWPGPGWYD